MFHQSAINFLPHAVYTNRFSTYYVIKSMGGIDMVSWAVIAVILFFLLSNFWLIILILLAIGGLWILV